MRTNTAFYEELMLIFLKIFVQYSLNILIAPPLHFFSTRTHF